MRLILSLALLAPPLAPACAQDLTATEADTLLRLIDTICMDLIPERNGCETAVLLTSERDELTADLVIFTDRREGIGGSVDAVETITVVRDVVYNGWAFGQSPSFEEAGSSLRLHSHQIGVGRYGWEQILTLAWRNGEVTLAGVTHSAFDRGSLRNMRCDVNMLSGDWEYSFNDGDKEPAGGFGGGPRLAIPITEWTWDSDLPAPCKDPLSWITID